MAARLEEISDVKALAALLTDPYEAKHFATEGRAAVDDWPDTRTCIAALMGFNAACRQPEFEGVVHINLLADTHKVDATQVCANLKAALSAKDWRVIDVSLEHHVVVIHVEWPLQ